MPRLVLGGAVGSNLIAALAMAVAQPDGTTVPVVCVPTDTCPAIDQCLTNVFRCAGEAMIDLQADATLEPDTFVPLAAVTVTFLEQSADSHARFGWYNADPKNASPTLHPITFPTNSDPNSCFYPSTPTGLAVTVDWLKDPAYAGGEIGLYLGVYWESMCPDKSCAGPDPFCDIFYSEEWRNRAVESEPIVHLLKYSSRVTPCRYYLAWEDWREGGDNDFDDYVFAIDGVAGGCGVGPDGEPGFCQGGESCIDGICQSADPDSYCICGKCTGLDPCAGVLCDEGMECDLRTGKCSDPASLCDGSSCAAGEICVEGTCRSENDADAATDPDTGEAGCGCRLGRSPS